LNLEPNPLLTLVQSGLPVALVFSAIEDERKSLAKRLTDVALKYRGRVDFATVDAEKDAFFLEHFGLSAHHLPTFAMQTADEIFKFEQDSDITADSVDEFIRRNIRPKLRSNPPKTFEASITS